MHNEGSGQYIGSMPAQRDPNFGAKQIRGSALPHQLKGGVPRKLGDAAKEQGTFSVDYFCDASAGSIGIDEVVFRYKYASPPLFLVWYLGSIDVAGDVQLNGFLVSNKSVDLEENGTLNFSWFGSSQGRYTLSYSGSSVNSGHTGGMLTAWFYYMVFYDETGLQTHGF